MKLTRIFTVLFVTFCISYAITTSAHAAPIYFSGFGAWDTVGNWYTDRGYTIPAGRTPNSSDDVYLDGTAYQGPADPTTVANFYVGQIGDASFGGDLTVTGTTTFGGPGLSNSSTYYQNGTITTNVAVFYNDASLSGVVDGHRIQYFDVAMQSTHDHVNTGPWTLVADGVDVDMSQALIDTNQNNSTYTTLSEINGGHFIFASPSLTNLHSVDTLSQGITLNATIDSTGGQAIVERGFLYGLTTSYGSTLNETGAFSTGKFSLKLTGLAPNTAYHFKPFARNNTGITYGNDDTFLTLPLNMPVLTKLGTVAAAASPFSIASVSTSTAVTVGYNCNCLFVHDVSDKTHPVTVATANTSNQPGFAVSSQNYVYVNTYEGILETWDLRVPSNPILVGSLSLGNPYGFSKMRIVGNRLYANFYANGLSSPGGVKIYSISNPATTTLISTITLPRNGGGGDVLPIGNYLYAADYFAKALDVYSISNINSPVLLKSITNITEPADYKGATDFEPWRLLNKGNALYLADDNAVQIYDISSSSNPIYQKVFNVPRDVEGTSIQGNLLYFGGSGVGGEEYKTINLWDITDPFNPVMAFERYTGQNNYWIDFDADGYMYINSASESIMDIYAPIKKPDLATSSPTSIVARGITLRSTLSSNNNATTSSRGFNYGLTSSYGSTASSTGSFDTGIFSQSITGLTCNTTYHYNSFATNFVGTATTSDGTFSTAVCPTAPSVTTSAASSVNGTSATLNGNITDIGNETGVGTDYGFIYGTSSTLSTGSATTSLGTYNAGGAFSGNLSSLTCDTTYYARAYVSNSFSTALGSIVPFTTGSCSSVGGGGSSSGSSISPQALAQLLTPQVLVPGCPIGFVCKPQSVSPVKVFILNRTVGDKGNDIKSLQEYLNAKGYIIAKIGPGSPGHETTLFGGLTRIALAKFQKANKISPAIGYFGPLTRKFIQNNP